ncbi:DNA excision repair protein ERCC-1 [Phragmites australis]|uniref:DNA excision repair protein ERCC-1 n=1 Tax=Phragmites australis TaxID=29695 RepID=UPI002D773B99|nr:DNA excision repair protein ERCC-1 [Phragmites australis]
MDGERERQAPERQPGKNLIKIPAYQEVFGSGTSSSSAPPSYNPPLASSGAAASSSSSSSSSGSFSQTFSFLKSSEFYSPPPPPPQPTTTPRPPQASPSGPVPQSKNAILVSHRQKGNPLLKHIRNARWTFADIVPDYVLGQSSCALYISIRYHLLHPDYLYYRIRELQKNFRLRVILCHVDVEDVVKPLHEITRTALLHDCTLLCGWSMEECGRYLETIKVYENKPADSIREHMDNDYLSRLTHSLTSIRRVNKTDVVTLGSSFGSLSRIMDASMEELARCPGIGERKVKRLHDTFHEPFRRVSARPNIVVPDTPEREKASGQPSSTNDGSQDAAEKPDASKSKKGSDVKSALTAAFAKYSEKIRSQGRDAANEAGEGTSSSTVEDGKTKN